MTLVNSKTERTAFGQALHDVRTSRNLSLAGLAGMLTAHQDSNKYTLHRMGDYEYGARVPTARTIIDLAELLGVPEQAVRWCALAGRQHPDIVAALTDPDTAQRVYDLFCIRTDRDPLRGYFPEDTAKRNGKKA